jgi:DnaK suppressor protein
MSTARNTSLTMAQRTTLEAELKLRQQALDRQLAEHQHGVSRVEHARELLQQDGDDAPQRDADREVDLARSDRELAELGLVSQALQRVHQPGYGQCADCGDAIPYARLQLEPWALRCVACETRAEGPGFARHSL